MRVALLYRGMAPEDAPSARLEPMIDALGLAGVAVEPVAYGDAWAAAVDASPRADGGCPGVG